MSATLLGERSVKMAVTRVDEVKKKSALTEKVSQRGVLPGVPPDHLGHIPALHRSLRIIYC